MFRTRQTLSAALLAAAMGIALAPATAQATFRYVDDDNVQCPGAPYRTIAEALVDYLPGDEIFVCGGTYPEQLVLEHFVPLRGVLDAFSNRPVLAPTSLPATRPTLSGENPVRAAIIYDDATIRLENFVIDVSGAQDTACSPILAGIYARNARGMLINVAIRGAALPARPDCDSGVGLLAESGPFQLFARLIEGRAAINTRQLTVEDYQRAAVVGVGEKTSVKSRDGLAAGEGKGVPWVQHGFQFSDGARGRLQDVEIRDLGTSLADRTAAGVLVYGSRRIRARRVSIANAQTGVFLVGDRNRVAGGIFSDIGLDGVVILGNRNRVLKTEIAVSSVDGVFIDGDDNLIRGGAFSDMPIGIWAYAGDGNRAEQVEFLRVPEPARIGGVRTVLPEMAAPFTTTCATATECDDANPCTTDACDAQGTCSNIAVADGTSCADADPCNGSETCSTGTCTAGTPLVCADGEACTTDVCTPLVGCQFFPLADGSSCADGDPCNGDETCAAGVCTAGASLVCDDGQECTADACVPFGGCAFTPVADGTPCSIGLCSGGVCL